jgi:hypothetical protein
LLVTAKQANEEARKACANHDIEAAKRAADRAETAAGRLKELIESKSGRMDARRILVEAQAVARSARGCAQLAEEESQCRNRLASLKVKAYRSARGMALSGLLSPVAQAAEKAAQRGPSTLSMIDKNLAGQAWNLSCLLAGRQPLSDGKPDWPATAADLRNWTTNSPVELNAFLALGFRLLGFADFALAEMESVDAAQLTRTNALLIYHGGRALIYVIEGWDRMAEREVDAFAALSPAANDPVSSNQAVAIFHGFMACEALQKKDFARADEEIARGLQA